MLVVLPTWVGDCVMATPTLRALRTWFAQSHITFLAVPNLAGLIESGPWMDDVVTWPTANAADGVAGLVGLAWRLRREKFDLAVLLPNSFRAALVAWLSGTPRRVGYVRDGRGWLLTDGLAVPRVNGRIEPHPICGYYGRIAERLGCEHPGDRLELFTSPACDAAVRSRLEALGVAGAPLHIVISPGASFGASKLWPAERFAGVADRLIEDYAAAVTITCGPGEEEIARTIGGLMRGAGHVLDEPLLTLGELKALIRASDLLLCNDTGPRHIAKAFGVAVVTVFGPTHQAWTNTAYELERRVQVDVDCGPCQEKVCPLGHHECMTGVSVDRVYGACAELLAATGRRAGAALGSARR